MVAVMKLEKAPKETYADIGGLTTQIQEIKVRRISSEKIIGESYFRCDNSLLKQSYFYSS